MKTKGTKGNLSSRELILIFVLLATGILVAGNLFYTNYVKNYQTQAEQQLSAIADLKVGELVQWRKERLGDANLLYKNPAFSSLVQRYFEHPDDVDAQTQLRSWLTKFQTYDQYARVFLLDTRGAGRIFVPDTAEPVPRHIAQDAYQVMQSGKVTILDLDLDEDTPQPHMVILTPIFREEDDNVPLGVVVMRIDPYQYLYPLIQEWPTPSMTAETLIIRRDGNDALYLNELKFRKDTALKLRSSLENVKMPAVLAALGNEGIVEGIDYRGVPVIADVRHIPDSPWLMVARIDTAEVYAPLTQMLWVTIALVGALLIGAGAGVGLVWRQQNIRVYKERAEIAEALRASEFRYRDLVNFSKNGVAVYESAADGEDFIFKDFNRAAERIDNIKKEDIIGKSVLQAFPGVKEFGLFDVLQRVWRTGVPERHPITQYHDDRISGWRDNYVYRLPKGEIVVIYEDVTERILAEQEIMLSAEKFSTFFNSTPSIAAISDVQSGLLVNVNKAFIDATGYTRNECIGRTTKELKIWVDPAARVKMIATLNKGKTFKNVETRIRTKSGELITLLFSGDKITIGKQELLLTQATDITQLIKALEELKNSREQLRNFAASLQAAREQERKEIALEIHDDFGQALTALQIDLAWMAKRIYPDHKRLVEKVDSMLKLIKETDKKVKHISSMLRPPLLDDLGLAVTLQAYVKEFGQRTGIKCDLRLEPEEIALDEERSIAVFRIVQEALTNIVRHAAASRARIAIQVHEGGILVEISDNGRGIGAKDVASNKSLGIIGMRERAATLGGTIEIKKKRGRGTALTARIPFSEDR